MWVVLIRVVRSGTSGSSPKSPNKVKAYVIGQSRP